MQAEGGGTGHPGAGADGGAGELEEGPERRSHPGPHHRAQGRQLHPAGKTSPPPPRTSLTPTSSKVGSTF